MMAINAEVFCRHSFGRRYAPSLMASLLFCVASFGLFHLANPNGASTLLDTYLLIFFILVLFHIASMWRRRAILHSYFNGLSWPIWERSGIHSGIVQLLCEPSLHVLAALLIGRECALLSGWLLVAGICLFVKEAITRWKHRNRVIDSIDARLEGERISGEVRRQTAPHSGAEQPGSPVVPVEQAQLPPSTVGQIYSRLDPALQRLLSPRDQNSQRASAATRPASRQGARRYHAGPLGTLPRITSRRPNQST